jgi:hypothetical protein
MKFEEFVQLYIDNSKPKPIRPICNAPLGIKKNYILKST